MKSRHWKALQKAYLCIIFSFFYLPIAVMAAFSFNQSKSRTVFTGFTFKWYLDLFRNQRILDALWLSLGLALAAATVATVVGTMAAIGINAMRKTPRAIINNISYLPVVNPEIITGVSLMLLFVVGKQGLTALNGWLEQSGLGLRVPEDIFGLPTLLIAHVTFCLPYVIFNVSPKLRQMDIRLYEAALDLGCNPHQAFFKVVLPEIMPAVLSAFLISLTYSIDDFIISYFSSGNMQTLPISIYSMTRRKVSPEVYALSTVMFLVILSIILFTNAMDSRQYKKEQKGGGRG